MPNVVGLDYPAALLAMDTAGVRVTPFGIFQTDPCALIWQQNKAVVPGVVISQVPTAGTTGVAPNSAMALTVSNYPVSVAYPGGGSQVDV